MAVCKHLCNTPLTFVTGKGGVGKTTVASALALYFSQKDYRTLLIEFGNRNGLANFFELHTTLEPGRFYELSYNLHLLSITPQQCLSEYGLRKLRFKTLFKLIFGNPTVAALLRGIPGMDDLLLLGKILYHVDGSWGGKDLYQRVIVDAPSTGQGIALFSLTGMILEAVKTGPMVNEVKRMHNFLHAPESTSFILTTIPEELAVEEAIEMYKTMKARFGLSAARVVVNKVLNTGIGETEAEIARTFLDSSILAHFTPKTRQQLSSAVQYVNLGLVLYALQQRQLEQIRRLQKQLACPTILLDWLPSPPTLSNGLKNLAQLIAHGMDLV